MAPTATKPLTSPPTADPVNWTNRMVAATRPCRPCGLARWLGLLALTVQLGTPIPDTIQARKSTGDLLQAFGIMLRTRCPERLEPWLQQAAATDIQELCSFVGGIERDYATVANALRYSYSQGPVEGQITRLKLLKRAMYGRAKPDLLEQRLLYLL